MVNPRRRSRRSTLEGNVQTSAPPPAGERKQKSGGGFPSSKGSPFMVSGELFLRSTRELLFSDLPGSSRSPSSQQTRPTIASRSASRTTGSAKNTPTATTTRTATAPTAAAAGTAAATAVTAAASHPSAGLLAGLSGDLRDLLLCHPDLETNEPTQHGDGCPVAGRGERVVEGPESPAAARREDRPGPSPSPSLRVLVSSARRERRSARLERIEHLKTSRAMAGCMATTRVIAVQKAVAGFKRGCDDGRARLDTRLGSLVLR